MDNIWTAIWAFALVVTSADGILVTTLGVVISDGKDFEDSGNTTRGTVDDEEGDMRRRGARECDEALMEATEARRGYARVAAWGEGNLIQAMARLKNPTIAWRWTQIWGWMINVIYNI